MCWAGNVIPWKGNLWKILISVTIEASCFSHNRGITVSPTLIFQTVVKSQPPISDQRFYFCNYHCRNRDNLRFQVKAIALENVWPHAKRLNDHRYLARFPFVHSADHIFITIHRRLRSSLIFENRPYFSNRPVQNLLKNLGSDLVARRGRDF